MNRYDAGVDFLVNALSGENWSELPAGLPEMDVSALMIDPAIRDALYAGTRAAGVFRIANR